MNNALEVVAANPTESKAIVTKCGQRIEGYNALLHRQERLTDVVRLAIGLELAIAKPHLEQGEFQPFIEKRLPLYGYRTAARWMLFAQTVLDKSDPGSLLLKLPEKARNGGIDESELPQIAKALEKVTGGQPHDDWTDENAVRAKGGLLPIRFHCPSCLAKEVKTVLKQVAGRNIQCHKCGETVKAKPDAKDTTAAERERVDGELNELAAKLDGLFNSATGDAPNQSERALCSDEAWRNLVRACQQISTFDRQHGKEFRKKISPAKAAKAAKEGK